MEKGSLGSKEKYQWDPESEAENPKRLNWGPKSKDYDKQLLKEWLDDAETSAGDKPSKFEWQDESSEHPKLHIQTKREFWYKKDGKDNSNKLSYDQLHSVIKRLKYLKIIISDSISDSDSRQGCKSWSFTLQLWSKDTDTNLRKFEEIYGKEYDPENPKEPEQGSPNNPSAVDTSDVDVEQYSDIEQQSIENKKLSYSDPLLDCAFFQGRQNELKTLTTWLKNETIRFIGIKGEGGIGKSTLAAKVFTDSRDFAGKGWFDLRTKPSITEVAERALQEFGVSPELTQFIEKKDLPQRLLRQLQSGRYLLALDNLESILTPEGVWLSGYEDFVYEFIEKCRPSVLLLTGRESPPKYPSWRCSEWLKLETGLESSEGAALLEALEAEGTKAEREKVSVQVQGYPLALSLLAGWLREEYDVGDRSVQHLLNTNTQLDLFQVQGRHRSEKQISVERVFDWSFNRLSPDSQNLLTQVSVLRGAFNTNAATQLVQRSVEDKELQDLERRSLLQKLTARDQHGQILKLYRLQPRIRDFAQKRAGDLTAAHERAITYFRSQYRTNLDTATTQEDAKEYLEIFHHQCELQRYQAAAQTIFACNDFLQRRGYFQLLVELYTQLDTRWQVTSDQHQKDYARLCFNLGIAYDSLGQYKRAIEYQNKSLKIRKDIGDREGEASCLRNLGNAAYTSQKDYEWAIKRQQESLTITREIGDRHGEAKSLGNLGNVYTDLKEYTRASDDYEQSLEILREIDEPQEEAKCLSNLGNVYTSLGQYKQAIKRQNESLKIIKNTGDRKVEAYCLGNLGNIHTHLKEYEQAIGYYKQSLKILKEIGDYKGEADCLFNLGNVYTDSKQSKDALEYLQQALDIYEALQFNHEIEQCKAKMAQNNGFTPPL